MTATTSGGPPVVGVGRRASPNTWCFSSTITACDLRAAQVDAASVALVLAIVSSMSDPH